MIRIIINFIILVVHVYADIINKTTLTEIDTHLRVSSSVIIYFNIKCFVCDRENLNMKEREANQSTTASYTVISFPSSVCLI